MIEVIEEGTKRTFVIDHLGICDNNTVEGFQYYNIATRKFYLAKWHLDNRINAGKPKHFQQHMVIKAKDYFRFGIAGSAGAVWLRASDEQGNQYKDFEALKAFERSVFKPSKKDFTVKFKKQKWLVNSNGFVQNNKEVLWVDLREHYQQIKKWGRSVRDPEKLVIKLKKPPSVFFRSSKNTYGFMKELDLTKDFAYWTRRTTDFREPNVYMSRQGVIKFAQRIMQEDYT
jgi:hypothetical protein